RGGGGGGGGRVGRDVERGGRLLRFGRGGDVDAIDLRSEGGHTHAAIRTAGGEHPFELPFAEAYNVDNVLAGVAVGLALEFPVEAMARRAAGIVFSRLRGELVELPEKAILINDSYNANPI